uniref:Sugar transporter SWEET n=1 Tax=Strongyloides venezuelensis TaxID=75913 RepID=A0A0K0EXX5_STRVS
MNFVDIFGIYVGILGISLCLLPIISIKQWIKKKSSDGFPSAGYSTSTFINGVWLKYGLMSQIDNQNTFLVIMLILNGIYSLLYLFYTSNKKRFIGENLLVILFTYGIIFYTDLLPFEDGTKFIGRVASFSNSLRFVPAFADIYNVIIKTKTTEYIPFQQTCAFAFIISQFFFHSLMTNNYYKMYTQFAGMATIGVYFALYYFYPPQTWDVPIFNKSASKVAVNKKETKKSK